MEYVEGMERVRLQRTAVLGVTGGVAAYKACELLRALQRGGLRVKVVMTESATRFVGPATFRALTGEPVAVSLWDEPGARIHHLSLAEEADVVCVAPCTANVLAKLAHGVADDLLTTTVLAAERSLVLAPAMNVRMWSAEATREAVRKLRERGAVVVEPEAGELACGDVGEGRLAPVEEIADTVLAEAARSHDLAGTKVLVTAGGTQEPLDAVRFLGNRSSGKTGYAIAQEAARRGGDVTLVSAPTALPAPIGSRLVQVETALEMREAVLAAYEDAHCVVMTAAVGDLRPAEPLEGKMKKSEAPESIALERNPDILAELGRLNSAEGGRKVLVGFAAETERVTESAREKLRAKGADMIVANDVSSPGLGFGSDRNEVALVTESGEEALPEMSKRILAAVLLDRVVEMLAAKR